MLEYTVELIQALGEDHSSFDSVNDSIANKLAIIQKMLGKTVIERDIINSDIVSILYNNDKIDEAFM